LKAAYEGDRTSTKCAYKKIARKLSREDKGILKELSWYFGVDKLTISNEQRDGEDEGATEIAGSPST
jgi:hypothetical protein